MNKFFIWILLLVIGNSILFYDKELGLSVVLFIIPLLCFLIYVFKNKDLIKNKYGLLFMIPIVLLSLTYFIFNNNCFGYLNLLVIPSLFIIMYIATINPTNKIWQSIKDFFSLIFKPFKYIDEFCSELAKDISSKLKMSPKIWRVIKSIIIILPILIIVLLLLSSADLIFNKAFSQIFSFFKDMMEEMIKVDFVARLGHMIALFFYLSLVILFITNEHSNKEKEKKKEKAKDALTMKLLLTILNVVYVIFDIIQIKSLLFHSVGNGITYAEYARQGFFELMFVSIINITIILMSKKYKTEDKKFINIMSIIMVALTFIIIVSSFLRMSLYEQEYGYTLLRLLVYITLFTEVILLIPTIKYILNPEIKILRDYVVIIVSVYTFINFINIDSIIADRNIQRYYQGKEIDIYYLENSSTDNVESLISLYNKTKDKEIKYQVKLYLINLDTSVNGFQEYNLSKFKAQKLIKKTFK